MNPASIEAFDTWIRGRFRDLNTELEERYFALENPAAVEGVAPELTAALQAEGDGLVAAVATMPLLDLDAERGYDLLGNVGLYMAALRRHELTNPDREERSPFPVASGLAQRLASGLGVVPRFATAHVNLSNVAHRGVHKSFTWLHDELVFIEYNCLSILAYIRAADILRRVPPLGVTHPIATTLFRDARAALEDVIAEKRITVTRRPRSPRGCRAGRGSGPSPPGGGSRGLSCSISRGESSARRFTSTLSMTASKTCWRGPYRAPTSTATIIPFWYLRDLSPRRIVAVLRCERSCASTIGE